MYSPVSVHPPRCLVALAFSPRDIITCPVRDNRASSPGLSQLASAKRKPTLEDYRVYDGAHCPNLWKRLGDEWQCPACGRSKFEIMRWTKRQRFVRSGDGRIVKDGYFYGWMAGLHSHHDHAVPLTTEYPRPVGRFTETVICDQCNSADGHAKRRLGLPENFSFSPAEIRQFITTEPHGRHKIDLELARQIYLRYAAGKQYLGLK